jgi:flagellar hook-length control protein FliK
VLYSQEEQAASTNGLYQAKEQPLSGRDNTKAPDKALNNQASFDSIVNGADVGRSSNSKQDLNWQGREKQGLVDLDIQDRETERSAGSDKNNVNQFANLPSMVTTYEYNEATEKSIAVERAFTGFDIDLRSVRAESHEIRLVLEPENLGEIAITVVKKEDGISAKIRSEDREVCAAVSNHLQKLVNSIENKGITLNSVDIILGQAEGGMTFSQGFSSSGQEQQRGNTYQQPFKIEPSESSSFFSQWQATADPGTDKAAEDAVHTREYRV